MTSSDTGMSGTSRRSFLKTTGAVAATACLRRDAHAAGLNMPLGTQLYSVRDLLPKDFDGTLRQVHAAGYQVVEAAGYFNKTAAEWKSSMDAAGLRCISTHHVLTDLTTKLSELTDFGHAIGLEYMICSWMGMHRDPAKKGEPTLDDWRWAADQLNEIGQKVKAAGMQFGYHNHWVEFGTESGIVFYDELLKRTDPKYVVFEMDCGWVVAGGHSPVEYLSRSPERFPLFHIKDLVKQPDGKWRAVILGKGSIDYRPIFKAATAMKQYFIEQEDYTFNPIEDLRQDAEYMNRFSV